MTNVTKKTHPPPDPASRSGKMSPEFQRVFDKVSKENEEALRRLAKL